MTDGHRTDQRTREAVNNAMGELREGALSNLPKEVPIEPHAGLVRDGDLRQLLSAASASTDRPIEDTRLYRDMVTPEATRVADQAVREGNLSQVEYMTGWQDYQNDVSGLHSIQKLENWLLFKERCKIIYLAGHMGNGKTDFAYLLTDIIKHRSRTDSDLSEPEIVTNLRGDPYDSVTDWETFREWVKSGSHGANRWALIDEAAQAMTGYSSDREQVERLMGRLVKLARKYGVNIIFVGQTGMDLHADLRRLADYVEKNSLKTARFYASVKRGEGQGHLFDLDSLPPAATSFDTSDTASWSWSGALDGGDSGLDDTEVKQMLARRAAFVYDQTDWSQADAAEALSTESIRITQTDVSRANRGEYGAISA